MRTILVVALLSIVGCKGKDRDKAAEAVKPSPPAPNEPAKPEPAKPVEAAKPVEPAEAKPAEPAAKVLDFAPAKMIATPGGELAIDANGKVTLQGKEVGTLSPAGQLTSKGTLVAEIDADGKVEIMGWGPGEQLSVRADGVVLDHGKVALERRRDGTLVGTLMKSDELKGAKLVVDGDKAGYRALMFAWLGVSKTDRIDKSEFRTKP